MARPSPYDPAYAARARILCRLGADIPALARAFAVSPATLYRWLHAHPRFAAAVAMGELDAKTIIEPTRYERATGYEVIAARLVTRTTGEPVVAFHKKRVHADSRAALRWLRLRRPEHWTLGEGETWTESKWPEGAPWQKRPNESTVSQNPPTIRKIMADNIADMILTGEITPPELASLLRQLVSSPGIFTAKGDQIGRAHV